MKGGAGAWKHVTLSWCISEGEKFRQAAHRNKTGSSLNTRCPTHTFTLCMYVFGLLCFDVQPLLGNSSAGGRPEGGGESAVTS